MVELLHSLEEREKAAELAQALSDPNRVALLKELLQGPANVGLLSRCIESEQSATSHQLSVLRHTHLVQVERKGKTREYSIPENIRRVLTNLFDTANEHLEE